jgi:hypothetical protein
MVPSALHMNTETFMSLVLDVNLRDDVTELEYKICSKLGTQISVNAVTASSYIS